MNALMLAKRAALAVGIEGIHALFGSEVDRYERNVARILLPWQ